MEKYLPHNVSISTKWDDISWQKEFLEMKAHKPLDIRLQWKVQKDSRMRCIWFFSSGIQKTEENKRGAATAIKEKFQ